MGSLVKCDGCGERCGARPHGVYWRWSRADGIWKHYYQRICDGCYAAKILPLDVDYPADAELTCPGCGMITEADYDAIYTTSFTGKSGRLDTESPFCGACAAMLRSWIVDHARDTDNDVGAPGPQHEASVQAPSARQTLIDLGRPSNV